MRVASMKKTPRGEKNYETWKGSLRRRSEDSYTDDLSPGGWKPSRLPPVVRQCVSVPSDKSHVNKLILRWRSARLPDRLNTVLSRERRRAFLDLRIRSDDYLAFAANHGDGPDLRGASGSKSAGHPKADANRLIELCQSVSQRSPRQLRDRRTRSRMNGGK